MKDSVTIGEAGRVVLPREVRRQLRLETGDRLGVEIVAEGILLRSRERQADLVEENGLLVHEGEPAGDLARAVDRARSGRDEDVTGLRR